MWFDSTLRFRVSRFRLAFAWSTVFVPRAGCPGGYLVDGPLYRQEPVQRPIDQHRAPAQGGHLVNEQSISG
jgi:hypothetical protein